MIVLPSLYFLSLLAAAKSGASGAELMALLLLPILPFSFATSFANLFYMPLFLLKSKPGIGYILLIVPLLLMSTYLAVTFTLRYIL